ncbi:MAG: hypothetical protein ACOH2V_08800 [Candidatus Saccharimonadaceae bacterium]
MDIGDIGFLIVAFIVFIINFVLKANKEKTQSQKPSSPELPEPWEVKETLPPSYDNPFNREKKVEVIKKKTARPLSSIQESFENLNKRFQSNEEGMSSLSESLYKEDEMESISYKDADSTDVSYTDELFHGNITEELKKGIIYSEILHRKYE